MGGQRSLSKTCPLIRYADSFLCRYITRVLRTDGLKQGEKTHAVTGGVVHYAFGHNVRIPRLQVCRECLFVLNSKVPRQNKKYLIFLVMLMPCQLPFDL